MTRWSEWGETPSYVLLNFNSHSLTLFRLVKKKYLKLSNSFDLHHSWLTTRQLEKVGVHRICSDEWTVWMLFKSSCNLTAFVPDMRRHKKRNNTQRHIMIPLDLVFTFTGACNSTKSEGYFFFSWGIRWVFIFDMMIIKPRRIVAFLCPHNLQCNLWPRSHWAQCLLAVEGGKKGATNVLQGQTVPFSQEKQALKWRWK